MSLRRAASSVGGTVLAAATQGVASLRPARKPLHPDGEVVMGRIYRCGSDLPTGVAWIDEEGEDDVVVRRSRAIGLPLGLPDIHGLAVRIPTAAGDGDILFATTGFGRVTRFVLTASRQPRSRPLTTLLPYDTDSGALLLAAEGVESGSYDLSWARPSGEWHLFGVLLLSTTRSDDTAISFDPVQHQIPGLRQYPSVRRLRAPAYVRARRSRADTSPTTEETHHVH
ncbi:hypothetical protein GCM10023350_43540 [Nocardioides endophyticus]|uniref:Uncharacterized protein n=1 Tax=Nocardioides endophyticus TaxID=1353775 RepID=A0ABP8ZDJ5_9ACTN